SGGGFGRGKGWGGREEHEEAHRTLDLSGGWLEVGDRRRGAELGVNGNGGRRWRARFGRETAQSSSGMGGGGGGRGEGGWGVQKSSWGGEGRSAQTPAA